MGTEACNAMNISGTAGTQTRDLPVLSRTDQAIHPNIKISRLGLATPPGEIVYGMNRTNIVYGHSFVRTREFASDWNLLRTAL